MSLLLMAAIAAAVAASVGYMAGRRGRDAEREGDEENTGVTHEKDEAAERPALEGLPLSLGDVVLAGVDERWLAGAIVARENKELIAAVFLAPEGAATGAVVAFPPPQQDIYWLSPAGVDSPDEPPATLEIGGLTMRRRARLPATLERLGQGAPSVGEAGIVAMYEGGGSDVALVICSDGRTHAWAGRRLGPDEYERLGKGDLDP